MVKNEVVHSSGKRKTAIARVTIKPGNGGVRINSIPLETYSTEAVKMKIKEVMAVAADHVDLNKLDISVDVRGGGVLGQADAIASSIARGLSELVGDNLLNEYVNYNRTLIAGDHRQTEVHKPSQSSKGPRHRRQKSYR